MINRAAGNDLDDIEVSAVMPCLNEELTVGICVSKALQCFAKLGIRGEVVVADNGSSDRSCAIAEELGARVVQITVKGYGAALIAGIEAARGSIIIMGDSDDSYDWSALGPFIEKIRSGYDMVMGNRFKGGIQPGAMPSLHRYFGNPILSGISRLIYAVPVGDFHCGMRAFTPMAYKKIRPESPGMEFATELIAGAARMGLSITEIPIKLYPDGRNRPPHLRSFRDGWRHLRFILTYAPDHLYLLPGGTMLMCGLLMQALLLRGPVAIGEQYYGIHFLALGGLLCLVGFNVILMGMVTKTLMTLRYPALQSALVNWILSKFRLEHGLLLGTFSVIPALAFLLSILLRWLNGASAVMEDSIHPAFVSANVIALGINVVFASFMLQLLVKHHDGESRRA